MAEFILKDWYGKEKSFDHETIYVRGSDGELMPFTHGTGNPTLEDLEVTENGNYTPSEGVDGFGSVSVNVPDIPAVIQPLEITENGTYNPPEGVDGFSPVTVDVKASGGGLPAGGYWKAEKSSKPYSSDNCVFVYNGKRYLYTKSEYNDSSYDIYCYENNEYTLVATDVFNTGIGCAKRIEYKGKMHFTGSDGMYSPRVWDGGATFTTMASLPAKACAIEFVIDDELYIKTNKSGFYKWIEASDTWEAVAVSNCPNTTYEGCCVIGRKIYIVGNNKIHEVDWDAKTCTTIETNPPKGVSGTGCAAVLDGHIYFFVSGSYSGTLCAVYKYDLQSRTYEYVAGLQHNLIDLYVYNNRIYANGNNSDISKLHQALYEVTE